jgi:membrane-bound metal-dependent hydrolase YbcI (DUF457 family)
MMANFSTHFNGAAIVGGLGATGVYYVNMASKDEATAYFIATIIGGILPDIDSDHSTPIKIMQYILANLISFFVLFSYIGKYPILNLVLIWGVTYLVVMTAFWFFKKVTVHRGMFHSIPSGFIFWFLTTLALYYVMKYPLIESWYFGMFIFIGFIAHLVLDELYSVDVTGARMKRSFGSALKLFNKDIKTVALFYVIAVALFFAMPQKNVFLNSLENIHFGQIMKNVN